MVTLSGASRPAAMACWPLGWRRRKSPSFASCRSRFTSRTDIVARSSTELRPLGIGALAGAGGFSLPFAPALVAPALVMSGGPAPGVDGSRLRLPDAGGLDAGQRRQRAELRAERHPVVGLGHHGGLASDGVAQHGEAVAG